MTSQESGIGLGSVHFVAVRLFGNRERCVTPSADVRGVRSERYQSAMRKIGFTMFSWFTAARIAHASLSALQAETWRYTLHARLRKAREALIWTPRPPRRIIDATSDLAPVPA